MIEPGIDVAGDIAGINDGLATIDGNTYTINGRTYGMHSENGRTFPISGNGFHQFDRLDHKMLRLLNSVGIDDALTQLVNEPGFTQDKFDRVRQLWELC